MNELIENVKKDKYLLRELKELAVKAKACALADSFREMEKELFPETEEQKVAKKEAEMLNLVFRMVGMNIDEKTCWLINETLRVFRKKKSNITMRDSARIKAKSHELFD